MAPVCRCSSQPPVRAWRDAAPSLRGASSGATATLWPGGALRGGERVPSCQRGLWPSAGMEVPLWPPPPLPSLPSASVRQLCRAQSHCHCPEALSSSVSPPRLQSVNCPLQLAGETRRHEHQGGGGAVVGVVRAWTWQRQGQRRVVRLPLSARAPAAERLVTSGDVHCRPQPPLKASARCERPCERRQAVSPQDAKRGLVTGAVWAGLTMLRRRSKRRVGFL